MKKISKRKIEYWQQLYPEKSLEECKELTKKFNKESCSKCIEFYLKRYPEKSLEECKEMLNNHKNKKCNKNNKYNITYW